MFKFVLQIYYFHMFLIIFINLHFFFLFSSLIEETMANVQSHSTYNRTYERKIIEEGTKGSPITNTSILSGIPVMSAIPASFHIVC